MKYTPQAKVQNALGILALIAFAISVGFLIHTYHHQADHELYWYPFPKPFLLSFTESEHYPLIATSALVGAISLGIALVLPIATFLLQLIIWPTLYLPWSKYQNIVIRALFLFTDGKV